jgi:L-lactate utilization protein LutC
MNDPSDPTDRLADQLRANRCSVHIPALDGGVDALIEVLAPLCGPGPVALPTAGDAALDAGPVARALEACTADVIRPDSPRWGTEIAATSLGIARACVAAADRGTLAVACSPAAPRSLTLLPATIMLVIDRASIHARFDDAWRALADGDLASGITWISGPSRTGDLEMILTWGVHGPARVEVVVLDAAT